MNALQFASFPTPDKQVLNVVSPSPAKRQIGAGPTLSSSKCAFEFQATLMVYMVLFVSRIALALELEGVAERTSANPQHARHGEDC